MVAHTPGRQAQLAGQAASALQDRLAARKQDAAFGEGQCLVEAPRRMQPQGKVSRRARRFVRFDPTPVAEAELHLVAVGPGVLATDDRFHRRQAKDSSGAEGIGHEPVLLHELFLVGAFLKGAAAAGVVVRAGSLAVRWSGLDELQAPNLEQGPTATDDRAAPTVTGRPAAHAHAPFSGAAPGPAAAVESNKRKLELVAMTRLALGSRFGWLGRGGLGRGCRHAAGP